MRKWRVGTVSMGISLILLGFFLFLSLLNGNAIFETFISWWPLILIVLGLEITIYSFLPKNENGLLKYDFLSIFFVGIIGTIAIAMTILTSMGFIDGLKGAIAAERISVEMESTNINITDDIKRVVLKTKRDNVMIIGTNDRALSIFGTYETSVNQDEEFVITKDDYIIVNQIGDTLYLQLKTPPEKHGMFGNYSQMDVTVAIPEDITLEVDGSGNNVNLNINNLQSSWSIKNAYVIDVTMKKTNNVQVSSTAAYDLEGNVNWIINEKKDETNGKKIGKATIGLGLHHLQILDVDYVNVNVIE